MRALDTRFAGDLFRSRLEARYAVLFKGLEIDYQYEPEGFDLDGDFYLPDFKLTRLGLWAEVKAEAFTDLERRKCERLASFTGWPVVLLAGQPENREYEMLECTNGLISHTSRAFGELDVHTRRCYQAAREARFEHGQQPEIPVRRIPIPEGERRRLLRAISLRRPWLGQPPIGVIARLVDHGVVFTLVDGEIVTAAPEGLMTDEMTAALEDSKSELRRLMEHFGPVYPKPEWNLAEQKPREEVPA